MSYMFPNYQSVVWPAFTIVSGTAASGVVPTTPSTTPTVDMTTPTFGDELRGAVVSSGIVFNSKPEVAEWFVEWRKDNIEKIKEKALQRPKIGGREITISMVPVNYPSDLPEGTGRFYREKVQTELEKELGVKAKVGCWRNAYIDPFFSIDLSW